MGKAFYKGGFEPKMNKKEASLILSLKYDPPCLSHSTCAPQDARDQASQTRGARRDVACH